MKTDLVMWTYNSARTLCKCLPTIDAAIPEESICHKIAVDGGSSDGTLAILDQNGWSVERAPRKGIPYQANHALRIVDSEFFASFEHDIVLNKNWFARTSHLIQSDPIVGAVQGVRLFVGSKTMQAIEEWQYRANLVPTWVYSIDNTLFRTEAVKEAGGFSDECMASADGILRRNMFKLGYEWVTDSKLISGHYRKSFFEHFKHQMRTLELAKYYWSYNPENARRVRRIISTLGGDPRFVLNLAIQSRMLRVPMAWYILRLQKGIYLNLPHADKGTKRVAMDHWYLAQFKKAVRESSENYRSATEKLGKVSAMTSNSCAYCGSTTPRVYDIPRGWSLIIPKLQGRTSQTFSACSDEHADIVAEQIFKDAFDFVSPNAVASDRLSC